MAEPGAIADAASQLALRTVARWADGTSGASLTVEGPGSRSVRLGAEQGSLQATIRLRDRRAVAAVLAGGSAGLAESYASGWWDSKDTTAAVRALLRLSTPLRSGLDRVGRSRPGRVVAAVRAGRGPSAAADRDRIAAHYDLSNDLFALMLDPTMTYSCAVFEHPDATLEAAQLAKVDRLAAKLELTSSDHVIEIGTGWGGLAIRLAQTVGCRVTTTTISEAQRSYAQDRVRRLALEKQVTVIGDHYRELRGTFDALVSVEMIEAVDWRHHDEFFSCCARLLAPSGRMALQAITMADQSFDRAKQHQDFIRRTIFPGGCIPSMASMTASVARTGNLRLVDVEDIGLHYAETLRRWQERFGAQEAAAAALGFDERFRRLWHLYLAYCQAAFLERHISDVQMVLARPGWAPRRRVRPC